LILKLIDLPPQVYQIEQFVGLAKLSLVLLGNVRASQYPGIGGERVVIGLLDLAANADLLFKLHHRQEEVDVEVPDSIQAVEEVKLFGGVVAVIANGSPHNRPVLLLDIGIVILLTSAAAGEGDFFIQTVAVELIIDELGAIVGIDA
jgi:hypothetical protein